MCVFFFFFFPQTILYALKYLSGLLELNIKVFKPVSAQKSMYTKHNVMLCTKLTKNI